MIVDEHLDILHFRGRTGRFLDPAPGTAALNLLKLVRPELLPEVRQTVHAAQISRQPASSGTVHLGDGERSRSLQIEAIPLGEGLEAKNLLLVLFTERTKAEIDGDGADEVAEPEHPRVRDLERELASVKEYLQTTIEELETTIEELETTIEELQSANEELETSKEELETSKEELQSTNEELATVNEELHTRMAQLSVANDDLQNVLASTTAPSSSWGSTCAFAASRRRRSGCSTSSPATSAAPSPISAR